MIKKKILEAFEQIVYCESSPDLTFDSFKQIVSNNFQKSIQAASHTECNFHYYLQLDETNSFTD